MSKIKTITALAVIIASTVLTQAQTSQGSLPKLVSTTTNTQVSVSSVSELSSSSLVVSSVNSSIVSSEQPAPAKIVKPAPVVELPKAKVEVKPIVAQNQSKIDRWKQTTFGIKNKQTGQQLLDRCNSNNNAKAIMQVFKTESDQAEVLSCFIMSYENWSFKADTVGVCNKKYQIGGDYRNCIFADINSNGMDVGLIQINSYFQSKNGNIAKSGGPDCVPTISNGRDRSDPCNQEIIEWLSNPSNNAKVALRVWKTQGITAWHGANQNIIPFY